MPGFGQLDRYLTRIARNVRPVVSSIVQTVATTVLEQVVYDSPADEGTFRSNYKVGLDQTPIGVRAAFAPGRKLGKSERANAEAAIGIGKSVIKGFRIDKNKDIIIVNNTEYGPLLNAGSSTQAPAGFVQRAVNIGLAKARSIRFRLDRR